MFVVVVSESVVVCMVLMLRVWYCEDVRVREVHRVAGVGPDSLVRQYCVVVKVKKCGW